MFLTGWPTSHHLQVSTHSAREEKPLKRHYLHVERNGNGSRNLLQMRALWVHLLHARQPHGRLSRENPRRRPRAPNGRKNQIKMYFRGLRTRNRTRVCTGTALSANYHHQCLRAERPQLHLLKLHLTRRVTKQAPGGQAACEWARAGGGHPRRK